MSKTILNRRAIRLLYHVLIYLHKPSVLAVAGFITITDPRNSAPSSFLTILIYVTLKPLSRTRSSPSSQIGWAASPQHVLTKSIRTLARDGRIVGRSPERGEAEVGTEEGPAIASSSGVAEGTAGALVWGVAAGSQLAGQAHGNA